ncbi:shikimate kinase [Salegentibacter flavus]|uniref:Shikimate kinase n=1 Tax=Salegentibacter flavus TaxID=287099 RepID=A0A1I5D2M8_9FLAO|nr:shikimate kinase [Salegentibacter flavus]SFN93482.1 shikimate kinase [Salegentibacter flavus]
MKIFLAGYMGSGKSLLGKQLAKRLNHDFLDLDDQIEVMEGNSIHDIFGEKGELYFRKLETKVLKDVLEDHSDLVVSLGGGTPCYGKNLELIKETPNSKIIYLKASVEELTRRLFPEKIHRPVISHLETREALEEFIRKHMFERGYYYHQSDIIVNVDNAEPEDILNEIMEKLK